MEERQLLALDFDGVLHPGLAGTLIYIDRIEQMLANHPTLDVLFSTSWRTQYSTAEMASWFSTTPVARFVGSTPDLGAGPAVRQREILCWIRENGFAGRWAALDDDASLFQASCPNLVLCNTARGVRPAQIQQVIDILSLPTAQIS